MAKSRFLKEDFWEPSYGEYNLIELLSAPSDIPIGVADNTNFII